MTYANTLTARAHYAGNAVSTASPARLLVMLYERLVRDLVAAEQALAAGDYGKSSTELVHAQQIVLELRTSLDVTAWDGAAALSDLYGFLHTELVAANLKKDARRVTDCREIVEPLCDAWRTAAIESVRPA